MCDTKNLYSFIIPSIWACKTVFFILWNGPFRVVKRTVLERKMAYSVSHWQSVDNTGTLKRTSVWIIFTFLPFPLFLFFGLSFCFHSSLANTPARSFRGSPDCCCHFVIHLPIVMKKRMMLTKGHKNPSPRIDNGFRLVAFIVCRCWQNLADCSRTKVNL